MCSIPLLTGWYSQKKTQNVLATYEQVVEQTTGDEIEQLRNQADEYNKKLWAESKGVREQSESEQMEEYEGLLNAEKIQTGMMCVLEIPSIDLRLPVYHGTSEAVLKEGVGHLMDSSLPIGGENTHCVMTGHRGLASARLFTRLDELKEGDEFFLEVLGEKLAYKVEEINVILPEEVESLEIRPGEDLVSLVTCTPYGINTHRLVITGKRVVYEEKKEEEQPEVQLTPEEQKVVDDFAEKIDITSSALVMQYGSGAQKKIANFSDTALANVRTKDLGEVGDEIANLVVELKSFDAGEEEKGFLGFFKKQANRLDGMKARYDKAEVNVNKIASSLEGHQVQLMKDIVMLDKLYETNLAYHKELSMYILAGKKRLKRERETTPEELKAKAQRSGLPEDAQAANDFAQQCDSFEKKLHDLELTRMVSVQMSPQIRLVQNNDRLMAEKIQSTIVNTIPLWKSQMVLALGVAHSADAVRAQREVTDMTNELLRKNAEKLKMSTIELDEVVKIQEEGKTRRREAEQELGRLENELKQKLLDIRA